MSKISASRLARLLGDWSAGSGSLSDKLGDSLLKLVNDNVLSVGSTLPSERSLAEALAVSRGTIVGGYSRVREASVIDSRHGSGSRIVSPSPIFGHREGLDIRLTGDAAILPKGVDMSSGALPPSPIFSEIVDDLRGARDLSSSVYGNGYFSSGVPQLRWEVARYYSDLGMPTHPDNILITSGAQQALWLLANATTDPGDTVALEDPTYRGAIEAFGRRNAHLVRMTTGPHGAFDVQAFEASIGRRPKVVYLFTAGANPTGRTLSKDELATARDILNRSRVFVIEDGSQSELSISTVGPTIPLVAQVDESRAATIGTLSKLFWAGLRVGWIRGSSSLIRHLGQLKAAIDMGGSVLDQTIALKLFARLDDARKHRRTELRTHLQRAEAGLAKLHHPWQFKRPAGGTAIWARVPDTNMTSLAQRAARQGLVFSAGPVFSPEEGFQDFLRLPFVRPAETLEFALTTIDQMVNEARRERIY